LFSCSGTIVEFFEESNMIVTVANLVKKPDAVEVANNLKVGSIFFITICEVFGWPNINNFCYSLLFVVDICIFAARS
jgi:hypothetical protein